jgi:predicted amidohydrolase YtcJ
MRDGVVENYTAAMSRPYLDAHGVPTRNTGLSFVDPALLREAATRLDAEGFQVHVHAIGDRGAREALDAFEGTDPERRHHIAHLQLVDPDDVRRFADLGVAANLQMLWACLDEQMVELTLPFLGEERATWQYPFADLERAGARLVAGSDWPVSTPNPIEAIHVAVNRREYGEAGHDRFLPQQAIGLESAFAAYTSGSAWINHRGPDDDRGAGVLRPGATADLVVLDRDPFAGSLDDVGGAQVVSTWVDGTAVYRQR